jgi:hypothetical protein
MIVACLALLVSLTGTSIAAKHYLITSTKQIKPSVLKQLKGLFLALVGSMVVLAPAADSQARVLARPSPAVQDYPRLANLYAYNLPEQADAYSRYGLVVSQPPALGRGALAALKKASPSTIVLSYYTTVSLPVPGWSGQGVYYTEIYPGWWLTLVGTTLAAPVDATSTQVSVTDGSVISANLATSPDVLVDGESMHVTAVNGNTLSVQRGYYSTATAHAAGARIAAHVVDWPGVWMVNASSYCPVNPATGQTWDQYLAATATHAIAGTQWDGIYLDGGNSVDNPSGGGPAYAQIDANDDNIPDGGDGPSGTGWIDGMRSLLSLTRSLAPNAVIFANGAFFPEANGEEMEGFDNEWWRFDTYLSLAGPDGTSPLSIVNPDTADTGVQDLQTMRFGLGIALMGNGYFAYDYGDQNHGQTWWYDEYDDGAGSSLPDGIKATQTRLAVAPGTGSKFSVGDVVHVPNGVSEPFNNNDNDDEQMLVKAIHGDTLTVRRAYNGTHAAAHPAYSKVMTKAQIDAGQGWLGQPLGDAQMIGELGSNMLTNGSFEGAGSSWLDGWTTSGQSPAVFTVSQDNSTSESGQASAKVTVSTASPLTSWYANLSQSGLSLTIGTTYTLSFWAKGTSGEGMVASVVQAFPWHPFGNYFNLTSNWQQYTVALTPSATSPAKIEFDLAQSQGTIWIDDVSLSQGDPNVWRRDFTHGTVLLNGTDSPQTVKVGPGYHRISGTQDRSVNSGAAASSVTLPAHDAILLAANVRAAGHLSVTAAHRSIIIAGKRFFTGGDKVSLHAYGLHGTKQKLIGTASAMPSRQAGGFRVTSITQKHDPCVAGGFKHLEVDAWTTTAAGRRYKAAKARATVTCPRRPHARR